MSDTHGGGGAHEGVVRREMMDHFDLSEEDIKITVVERGEGAEFRAELTERGKKYLRERLE